MKNLKKVLFQFMLSILIFEQLVLADTGDFSDADDAADAVSENIEKMQDGTLAGKVTVTNNSDGSSSMHAEFTDSSGNVREYDFDRSIVYGQALDARGFVMNENIGVQVRDIPSPNEMNLHEEQSFREQIGKISKDNTAVNDFKANMERAQPEDSNETRDGRAQLETATDTLKATVVGGNELTKNLSSKMEAEKDSIDKALTDTAAPTRGELLKDEKVLPAFMIEFPAFNPDQSKINMGNRLAKLAASDPELSKMTAKDQAVSMSMADEVAASLDSAYSRIHSFAEAHHEALQAAGEIGIDIALTSFPVATLTWNVANLISMGATGKTLLGRDAHGPMDFALMAVGAIGPGVFAKAWAEVKDVAKVEGAWDKATFDCIEDNINFHWNKYAKKIGIGIEEYTDDAIKFYEKNKLFGKERILKNGSPGIKIKFKDGFPGGIFTDKGKIVTFWYK